MIHRYALLWFILLASTAACSEQGGGKKKWQAPKPLDSARAISNLKTVCDFGPRVSGTEGMLRQQEWIAKYLSDLGLQVEFQEFEVRHPNTGEPVPMKNLIARHAPAKKERFLLCAHYDTRPFPDRDLRNPQGVFLGANDGASGVAFLLEIAHALATGEIQHGVDLVLFDGEELIYDDNRDRDRYFLGATHFSHAYRGDEAKDYHYQAGILVDMIGDAELQLFYEENSLLYAPDILRSVWKVASKLKIDSFIPRRRSNPLTVRDDHLSLNQIAKIPTIDIIDFDYPQISPRGQKYWHTTEDLPNKCSGESICKVAAVVLEWLKSQ